ncbi:MAG: leucyl aminopeptidase [Desulfobulbaceae bacterium]|uniref:Probable cytosol aminopeptidase n=1 Tax=Candidatus Desulfatifera sulfidica TaxID=2841691 RepID=A0A8J6TEM1_9BACT|nr:leucyl aminopeptidase [Candidatus Desulfatifera sulfidica]
MEATKLVLSGKNPETFKGDLLVYCLEQPTKGKVKADHPLINNWLKAHGKLGEFSGKTGETLVLYPDKNQDEGFKVKRLMFLGIGKSDKKLGTSELRERCRIAGGHVAAQAMRVKADKIMVCLPELDGIKAGDVAETIVEGVILGDYRFLKYKKEDKDEPSYNGLNELRLYSNDPTITVRKNMMSGLRSAQAACKARDMANEPGNGWTPASFAAVGRDLAEQYGLQCTVLERADMEHLGMGGLLAVNQGSVEPPKMVILEYNPPKKTQTLLLVGKGLTFDSGGVSIKPSAGMEDMKYDMCGGAAVLAMMQAVGEEQPDVGVIAIVPATDNMPSGAALKPGDIITHYNGITSEVVNTDAEGRLILADAMAYGIKKFKPDCVVDLATLTGAVIVGLGHHYTGLLGNNDELVKRLLRAGKRCGEPLWRLPLGSQYSKQIESKVADIKNTGGPGAGTITAAAYLEKFVGDTPWAHLDIAGTAWNYTEKSYVPQGPSGVGVRTLIEFIRRWRKTGI